MYCAGTPRDYKEFVELSGAPNGLLQLIRIVLLVYYKTSFLYKEEAGRNVDVHHTTWEFQSQETNI